MITEERLTVVFFGTPPVAVPALEILADDPRFTVLAAVTQTDKPAGRGHKLQPSPVKVCAGAKGIRLFQPASLKKPERADGLVEFLQTAVPDFFVVVAYGKIIPPAILAMVKHASVNIHFSLLPRWRGAAPLQRAILAGDKETGVSLMQMEEGLDTGPVYLEERLRISPDDTTGTLAGKLAVIGSKMLPAALPRIAAGELRGAPQAQQGMTHAEKLSPADFSLRWSEPAATIAAKIQAAAPAPGARAIYQGETIKLFTAKVSPQLSYPRSPPGTVVESNPRELLIQAGDGTLVAVAELQFPNRKRLPVCEIVKSVNLPAGSLFGDPP